MANYLIQYSFSNRLTIPSGEWSIRWEVFQVSGLGGLPGGRSSRWEVCRLTVFILR